MGEDGEAKKQVGRLKRKGGVEEEEKWVEQYSSKHQILLVGEGDFSFSLCLATAFGCASNIMATSLDSYDEVITKYKQGKSNLQNLKKLGATLIHGVDATAMKRHYVLKQRKFDRIIFNFPHTGFHGNEDDPSQIRKNRNLVESFFINANRMLKKDGQIHVAHKASQTYRRWKIEELARSNSLELFQRVPFKIEDYPGYNNKLGDGNSCDEPFVLGGESFTFIFILSPPAANKKQKAISQPGFPQQICKEFETSYPTKKKHQQTLLNYVPSQTSFYLNMTQIDGNSQPNTNTNITQINGRAYPQLGTRYGRQSRQTSFHHKHPQSISIRNMNQFNGGTYSPLGASWERPDFHVFDAQFDKTSEKYQFANIDKEYSGRYMAESPEGSLQSWGLRLGSSQSLPQINTRHHSLCVDECPGYLHSSSRTRLARQNANLIYGHSNFSRENRPEAVNHMHFSLQEDANFQAVASRSSSGHGLHTSDPSLETLRTMIHVYGQDPKATRKLGNRFQ